jgi:hypothetical protein
MVEDGEIVFVEASASLEPRLRRSRCRGPRAGLARAKDLPPMRLYVDPVKQAKEAPTMLFTGPAKL